MAPGPTSLPTTLPTHLLSTVVSECATPFHTCALGPGYSLSLVWSSLLTCYFSSRNHLKYHFLPQILPWCLQLNRIVSSALSQHSVWTCLPIPITFSAYVCTYVCPSVAPVKPKAFWGWDCVLLIFVPLQIPRVQRSFLALIGQTNNKHFEAELKCYVSVYWTVCMCSSR